MVLPNSAFSLSGKNMLQIRCISCTEATLFSAKARNQHHLLTITYNHLLKYKNEIVLCDLDHCSNDFGLHSPMQMKSYSPDRHTHKTGNIAYPHTQMVITGVLL